MNKVMTTKEVAVYLRVHTSFIYRLLKQREIPAFRIGSDWRYNVEDIDKWMVERTGNGNSKTTG